MAQTFVDFDIFAQAVRRRSGEIVAAGDDYAELMISAAEEIVRDEACQPGWVGGPAGPGEVMAPQRARIIATLLASRGYADSRNLSRRSAGPVAESFRSDGPSGLALDKGDLDWLHAQRPGGAGGLGVITTSPGMWPSGHYDRTPDGFSVRRGDLTFMHGAHMEDV